MKKVLIFGGTTEGREIAKIISEKGIFVVYSVATEYGKDVLNIKNNNIEVKTGRMTEYDIKEYLENNHFDFVVDATHPYAVDVSRNIKGACSKTNNNYIRLLRQESPRANAIYVDSIEEACKIVDTGNVLAATGSKEIKKYQSLKDYKTRLFARVLPSETSVNDCLNAGVPREHIIESFGAVSVDENMEVIKKYNIKTLITKDGGKNGGFEEKCKAAENMGIKLICIKRPFEEKGYSIEEVTKYILGE